MGLVSGILAALLSRLEYRNVIGAHAYVCEKRFSVPVICFRLFGGCKFHSLVNFSGELGLKNSGAHITQLLPSGVSAKHLALCPSMCNFFKISLASASLHSQMFVCTYLSVRFRDLRAGVSVRALQTERSLLGDLRTAVTVRGCCFFLDSSNGTWLPLFFADSSNGTWLPLCFACGSSSAMYTCYGRRS